MWVITVFNKKDIRIFEYEGEAEALAALKRLDKNALLSYLI